MNTTVDVRQTTKSTGFQKCSSASVHDVPAVHFIGSHLFQQMDDQQAWKDILRDAARESETCRPARPVSQRRLPPHLEAICATPLLDAEHERGLFRRMNFLKYRANLLLLEHGPIPSLRVQKQVHRLLEVSQHLRNKIVEANTRLVISIVKKFCDQHNVFDELLSEGIHCLIKAVDKFDADRGFRFSTYVTCSVQREMVRLVKRGQRDRRRLTTGSSDCLESQMDDYDPPIRSAQRLTRLGRLIGILVRQLDEREQFIIKMRHGLSELGCKPTFDNLGKELGISKERVRQLEIRALDKLRTAAEACRLGDLLESA